MAKVFDAHKVKDEIIQWIRTYFERQPSAKGAVIGISGGKDSTVVAKLLVEAIGADRVYGVLMPNGHQADIDDSIRVCNVLGIGYKTVNIGHAFDSLVHSMEYGWYEDISEQAKINIAPRLRMTTLYAIGQSLGYRVAGTGNKSEAYVGYCTKWGDTAHDFNPIADLTKEQVVAVGDALGLPYDLVHKTPSDGLTGKTDEDNLGFTYEQVAEVIENGDIEDEVAYDKIRKAYLGSRHKFAPIPRYILR